MATTTTNHVEFDEGVPRAGPVYLTDPATGAPFSSTNPLSISLQVDAIDAQVTNDGTFAKETGGNLASVVTLLSAALATKRSAVAVYSLASGVVSSNGNSGDLTVSAYTEIGIDINMTTGSGTSPTVQFFWDRKGADGVYYPIYQSAVFSSFSATTYLSTAIGSGMTYALSLGITGRLRWVIGGSATPTVTFSANVYGK